MALEDQAWKSSLLGHLPLGVLCLPMLLLFGLVWGFMMDGMLVRGRIPIILDPE